MCYYQKRSLLSEKNFFTRVRTSLNPLAFCCNFLEDDMEQQLLSSLSAPCMPDLPMETYRTLTRREREILTLIAAGHSNRQMAECLVVSTETVKTHVRHVLGKLGVARKAEIRAILRDRRYQ